MGGKIWCWASLPSVKFCYARRAGSRPPPDAHHHPPAAPARCALSVVESGARMRERHDWLVQGGHCHSILNVGPFEIGIDFEPPAPAARKVWTLNIEPSVLASLHHCLARARAHPLKANNLDHHQDDASIFIDAMAHLDLVNGVGEALKWYVSDFPFQLDEKIVREKIKKLKAAIEHFKSALPEEYDAVGNFIWQSYTGEVFLRADLNPTEADLIVLQDAWRERFGFIAIRDHLDVMMRYVSAAEQCLGKRKPLEHRKTNLVRSLAWIWGKLTGEWPRSGRDPQNSSQTGPFADFVRIACGVLPDVFGIKSLDGAIRKVCEREPRNFSRKNSAA